MLAQHLRVPRDREWSSATGSQGKAETRGGKASLQTKRTEEISRFAGPEPEGSPAAAALRAGGEPGPGAAGGHHPPAFPGCLALPGISPGPPEPKAAGYTKLFKGTRRMLTSTACSLTQGPSFSSTPNLCSTPCTGECVRSDHRCPHTGDNRQRAAGPKRCWPQ